MIYPYRCPFCGVDFEIIKDLEHIDYDEICPKCGTTCQKTERLIAKKSSFYGEKVEDAEWCDALGCVVKNSAHRRKIAKERGLEEIGNEPVENIAKHFDEAQKSRQKASWAEFYEPITLNTRG